jgi:hypothetical protein
MCHVDGAEYGRPTMVSMAWVRNLGKLADSINDEPELHIMHNNPG